MFELLERGGVLMYPIFALSIISLGIFFERLYFLRREKYIPKAVAIAIRSAIKNRDFAEAEKLCISYNSAITRITGELLLNRSAAYEHLVSICENAGNREARRLSVYQEVISTIVSIAPLLGLLGTVLGMVKLFGVLSGGGIGDPQALSGGIAEALLTTAAGLSVAIPAQIFHYLIKSRSDALVSLLEKETTELIGLITNREDELS
ncbi:MAG: MotA/TolQ/ExbB proton channel family protein [Deferribacteraceae bacterium]|jgi:biopolymer transport protein ExbB|nr:MotA/TolQ/ExbB proton channel family protein [Deferribacteraceae bacterium]